MKQADIFLKSEGDAWFARNRDKLGHSDSVSDAIRRAKLNPAHVLEIGCANGWRLGDLREEYNCRVTGIEPSRAACIEATKLRIPVLQATADRLPAVDGHFDLIIYAFCLYVTDPDEWLRIASEGDRILSPGGHLVIHDFYSPSAFARQYAHHEDLRSYHFDFAKLWLAHPLYSLVTRSVDGEESVTIVRKNDPAIIEVLP